MALSIVHMGCFIYSQYKTIKVGIIIFLILEQKGFNELSTPEEFICG